MSRERRLLTRELWQRALQQVRPVKIDAPTVEFLMKLKIVNAKTAGRKPAGSRAGLHWRSE